MRILAISCSPRKGGNTETMLRAALDVAQAEGTEVELVSLAGKNIHPCDGCLACRRKGAGCHIQDDMTELYDKMWQADGILFGSPVYFWNVTAQAKALIDRTFAYSPEKNLRSKAAGAVVAQGRDGSTQAMAAFNSFFLGHRMIIIGNAVGFGNDRGSVKDDERGIAGVTGLAKSMVRYLKTGKL